MAERGDLTVLHEPFSNLKDYGETSADGRAFDAPSPLLAWLRDQAHRRDVFLKDTMDHQHDDVLADRRFLAEARHAFLIRPPRGNRCFLLRPVPSDDAAHHRPFYEQLYAQRMDVSPWERMTGS
jgi:hypothetical protein